MQITQDTRLEEIKRIEHLLYGINYAVWLNIYGPVSSKTPLNKAIIELISKDCEISQTLPSGPMQAMSEILEMVLFEGDVHSGPLELKSKSAEITALLHILFSFVDIKNANTVIKFELGTGHPAYPVFWDFAYDIHSNGKRWIFMGSSSD